VRGQEALDFEEDPKAGYLYPRVRFCAQGSL
jgi:hypothetical protein